MLKTIPVKMSLECPQCGFRNIVNTNANINEYDNIFFDPISYTCENCKKFYFSVGFKVREYYIKLV